MAKGQVQNKVNDLNTLPFIEGVHIPQISLSLLIPFYLYITMPFLNHFSNQFVLIPVSAFLFFLLRDTDYKLKKMGIQGRLLAWIESFLGNRMQRVVLNQTESKWRRVYSGVPQGSVLGPIPFLIYINDLPDYVKSSCKIFADDTKIYAKVGNMADVEWIQKDIDELVEWSRTWLLNFNAGKCSLKSCM